MTHKSNLISWSLIPYDERTVIFEAAIPTNAYSPLAAYDKDGVRYAYHTLRIYIHLN